MYELTVDDVIHTETGTPASLRMYAGDVHGDGSVPRAVDMLLAGNVVRYAVCERNPPGSGGPPMVREVITLQRARPGLVCVRYCGEGDTPTGAGSHTFYGSLDTRGDLDEHKERIIARLAFMLGCASYWCFLLNGRLKA